MNVQKKARHDNPFTEDEPVERGGEPDGVDVARVKPKEDERPDEKTISVEPPEHDDDEDGPSGPTPRQQKRRERYDRMQAETEAANRRATEAEQRAAAVLAAAEVAARQAQKPPEDPLDAEEKAVADRWMKHQKIADAMEKTGYTAEQKEQWQKEFFTIQGEQQRVQAEKVARRRGPQQSGNSFEAIVQAHVMANHSDLIQNKAAMQWADGYITQKLARERRSAPTVADYDEGLKAARAAFRLPGATPTPSEDTRRKFSGNGLGGASGASQNGGSKAITMNADMMKMAEAKYTHELDAKTGKKRRLKPEESHAKWARNEGKRVLERYQ